MLVLKKNGEQYRVAFCPFWRPIKMWYNYALTYKGVSLDILTRPTNLFLSRISSNLRLNVLSGTKPFGGETGKEEQDLREEMGGGCAPFCIQHMELNLY